MNVGQLDFIVMISIYVCVVFCLNILLARDEMIVKLILFEYKFR